MRSGSEKPQKTGPNAYSTPHLLMRVRSGHRAPFETHAPYLRTLAVFIAPDLSPRC